MHLQKKHYLTFDLDLGVKVIQNVAQYPLHHVTYEAAKFDVATSNDLGEHAFTRKYIVSRNAPAKFEVATSNS